MVDITDEMRAAVYRELADRLAADPNYNNEDWVAWLQGEADSLEAGNPHG